MRILMLGLLFCSMIIPMVQAAENNKILGRVISIPDRDILEERFNSEGLATFVQKDAVIRSLTDKKQYDLYKLGSKINISAKTINNVIVEKILKCLLPGDNNAIQAVKQWIAELNFHEIKT